MRRSRPARGLRPRYGAPRVAAHTSLTRRTNHHSGAIGPRASQAFHHRASLGCTAVQHIYDRTGSRTQRSLPTPNRGTRTADTGGHSGDGRLIHLPELPHLRLMAMVFIPKTRFHGCSHCSDTTHTFDRDHRHRVGPSPVDFHSTAIALGGSLVSLPTTVDHLHTASPQERFRPRISRVTRSSGRSEHRVYCWRRSWGRDCPPSASRSRPW